MVGLALGMAARLTIGEYLMSIVENKNARFYREADAQLST